MRARTLFVLIAVLLLVLGSSGCLSIDAVREGLLFRQEEPKVVNWKVTPPPVDYLWEANKVVPADKDSTAKTFRVKDGAKWLRLSYNIELPSSLIGEREILNYTIYFNPEVTLRLRMPNKDVIWERNFTESDSNTFPIQSPMAGTWTLKIEAKGYGGEAFGVETRDTVSVVVDIYEPK